MPAIADLNRMQDLYSRYFIEGLNQIDLDQSV